MLRVKKVTDAIFPRDFSEALKSYNDYCRKSRPYDYEKELSAVKRHYKKQLLNLKKQVKKVSYSEKYTKKLNEIQNLFNKDPYLYASKNKKNYQLSYDEIQNIEKEVSIKILKSEDYKEKIENKIKQTELDKITKAFNKQLENLNLRYPPVTEIVYEDTEESILFEKKYQKQLEEYANDCNLPLHPYKDVSCSDYAFFAYLKKPFFAITENKSMDNWYGKILIDINEKEITSNERQVIMYLPRLRGAAFFLYKNCLYQAEFNEFFTDEELLLKVKEKIYKEDKKFEQLKKQIELYENSDLSETSKKKSREPIPEDVKFEVWRRDLGRCVICGSQENLEFDHIIPFSKGGSSTARNIQLLCQNCNRHKSDKI